MPDSNPKGPQRTDTRLKACGPLIYLTRYSRQFLHGKNPNRKTGRKPHLDTDVPQMSKFRNYDLWRARNYLKDLVNSNCYAYTDEKTGQILKPSFATFTYADNEQSIPLAKKHFRDFYRRLCYTVSEHKTQTAFIKYVATIEFQQRGAIHFHTIFFNLPYIWNADLQTLWTHGFTDIQLVIDVQDCGSYIAKYIRKGLSDPRVTGEQAYVRSRGLYKPKKFYFPTLADQLIKDFPLESLVASLTDIPTLYLGKKDERQFNLTNFPDILKKFNDDYETFSRV